MAVQFTCICSEGSVDTDRSSYGVATPETHTHTDMFTRATIAIKKIELVTY